MNQVYGYVTQAIVEQLEKGVVPWHRPWRDGQAINYVSRKPYRGVNQFLLPAGGEYISFKQMDARGGRIKSGKKSHMVVFFKPLPRHEEDEEGKKAGRVLKYYRVFALEDIEGIPSKLALMEHQPIAEAEALIAGYPNPPFITHEQQNRAYYSPFTDAVVSPVVGQFEHMGAYYSTLFHELVHSTGHPSRLRRFVEEAHTDYFGSESYSKEELVAELGAAMLCAQCGIDNTIQASANYIGSWLQRLKNDVGLIISAAGLAQKAVDAIKGVVYEQEEAA